MTKICETLQFEISEKELTSCVRVALNQMGNFEELEEGMFKIKETQNGYSAFGLSSQGTLFTDKTYNPATTIITVYKEDIGSSVDIEVSAFGFMGGHCKAVMGRVKNCIITAVESNNKKIVPSTSVADELLKLKQLLDSGVLTLEEFEKEKKRLINN